MKQNILLVIASVLSILFMTFHQTDDIVRGMEQGAPSLSSFQGWAAMLRVLFDFVVDT
jgi:hypothetical protein